MNPIRVALGALFTALLAAPVSAQVQRPGQVVEAPAEPAPAEDDFARQLITAGDPGLILQVMQGLGYDATLTVDGIGDPMIEGRMSKSNYNLFFYGCTANRDCTFLLFVSFLDLPNGISTALIDDWNENALWGTAFRSEDGGDPMLSIPFNLFGGVTMLNFADTLDWFRVTVERFERHAAGAAANP
ncbi:MAG: YbjN domain-containing protein [Bauldia sp.]|nr:YbjN domain-containing protein [Bauldia sp.]